MWQFLFSERGQVVLHCRNDRRRIGRKRLHEHSPALRAAARAACHLRHELKRPLRRAEIGKVQRGICIHDAH